jgi:hypothetical protein
MAAARRARAYNDSDMGLFRSSSRPRHAVLIDVGSGSVLVSIVTSDPKKTHPDIVWARREYVPLRSVSAISRISKNVMASLVNAALLLETDGRRALADAGISEHDITHLSVTIAAPWSYTVTKTISYAKKEPFVISGEMLKELVDTAEKKVMEELSEKEAVSRLGLRIIARAAVEVLANGYKTWNLEGKKAVNVTLSQISAVAQAYLLNALDETKEKLLPRAQLKLHSFMMAYYCVIRELYPDTTECCLVDITFEATEIGVVRDGILRYCTHAPYGAYTLAREVAAITGVPLEEAYGYLKNDALRTNFEERCTKAQRDDLATLYRKYTERVTDLFHETGDSLAIPKTLFIHGNVHTESFFAPYIQNASKQATRDTHLVVSVTDALLKFRYEASEKERLDMETTIDTALLVSAQFFHMDGLGRDFERL